MKQIPRIQLIYYLKYLLGSLYTTIKNELVSNLLQISDVCHTYSGEPVCDRLSNYSPRF